jgi:hypothetical protein
MKKLKFLAFLMIAAFGAAMISSCGDGDDDLEPVGPTLNFLGGMEYVSSDAELTADSEFSVGIRGTHSENIEKFTVTLAINGTSAGTLFDSSFKSRDFDYVFVRTTGPDAQTERYSFTLTDRNGVETTRSITITNTGSGGAELSLFPETGDPFKVSNVKGPNLGAFDLVANGPQAAGDPNDGKDIQDSTGASDLSGGRYDWPARWTSRNGTMFKTAATSFDAITNEANLASAWANGGTETNVLQNIQEGDVYIAKLRGGDTYVAINIVEVFKSASDNSDYISFEYKKVN